MGRARVSLQSTRRRALVSCQQCRSHALRLHKWHTPLSDRGAKAGLSQLGLRVEKRVERDNLPSHLEALALRKRPIYPPLGSLELPRGHPLVLGPDDVLAGPDADPAFMRAEEAGSADPVLNPYAALTTSQLAILGFTCGGGSGSVARSVVHPLDTLRVLQSVSSKVVSAEV